MDISEVSFNEVVFKSSHNSSERKEDIYDQLVFNPDEPFNGGCAGLEFDVWRHSSPFKPSHRISFDYFTVHHNNRTSRDIGPTLNNYFDTLKLWHRHHPQHLPILINLDLKSKKGDFTTFPEEIDTYLECYLGKDLLFTPQNLVGKNPKRLSLCEYVAHNGWPSLKNIGAKFIICLTGNPTWKHFYAAQDIQKRYCFADNDISAEDLKASPPINGNFVFFNMDIRDANPKIWPQILQPYAAKNLITKVWEINTEKTWRAGIEASANALITNKISHHSWAQVSKTNIYARRFLMT